jgi:hypothetical protein
MISLTVNDTNLHESLIFLAQGGKVPLRSTRELLSIDPITPTMYNKSVKYSPFFSVAK